MIEPLHGIYERVKDIARGAALMTGTEFEISFHAGASNFLLNDTIVDVLSQKMAEIGSPQFTEAEIEFARKLSTDFPGNAGMLETLGKTSGPQFVMLLKKMPEELFAEVVLPSFKKDIALPGG